MILRRDSGNVIITNKTLENIGQSEN